MIPGHHDFVTDRMRGLPLNVPSHRRGDVLLLMPYCGNLDVSKGHLIIGMIMKYPNLIFTLFFG